MRTDSFFHFARRNCSVVTFGLVVLVMIGTVPAWASSNESGGAWEATMKEAKSLFEAGKIAEATVVARKGLALVESESAPSEDRLLKSLLGLSTMLLMQGELQEVETLVVRAHGIASKQLDSARSAQANTLKYLGAIYMQQGKLVDAEPVFKDAVKLSEETVGSGHPETAKHIGNLGALYLKMGDVANARKYLEQALGIWKGQPEPDPVYTVGDMTNLAALHIKENRFEEALRLFKDGLAIQEKSFGENNPRLVNLLTSYAAALDDAGKVDEAVAMRERIRKIAGQ